MVTAEQLDVLIDNASPQTLGKAKRMLKSNSVRGLTHNDNEIRAKVHSESSMHVYEVSIDFFDEDDEDFEYYDDYDFDSDVNYHAECTCPLHWGDCKHIVAVALAARTLAPASPSKIEQKEVSIRLDPPWADSIARLTPYNHFSFFRFNHQIEISSLTTNGFVVNYQCEETRERETFKLETEGDVLVISGKSFEKLNRLSQPMVGTLYALNEGHPRSNKLESIMKSAQELKATLHDPLLKEYDEYVKEEDLRYIIRDGKISLVMDDTSLVLPPQLKNMSERTSANILSDRAGYNQHLLASTSGNAEWGYGFFMEDFRFENLAPVIKPLKGKWNKEYDGFKSNLTSINISEEDMDFIGLDSDFLTLVVKCRQLRRYNRSLAVKDLGGSTKNSETYQAFATIHQMLVNLIPALSKYPFYFTTYSPGYQNYNLRKNDTYLYKLELEPVKLQLNCTDGKKYFECNYQLLHNGEELPLNKISFFGQFFLKHADSDALYHLATAAETWLLQELTARKKLRTPMKLKEQFINNYLIPISKRIPVTYNNKALIQHEAVNTITSTKLYLSELGENILFQPHVVYGAYEMELFSGEEYIKDENGKFFHLVRQREAEDELKQFFASLHPEFTGQLSRGFLYLHYREMLHNGWFMTLFEKLNARNIEILGFNKLSKLKYNPNRPAISIKVGSGIDWFDIRIKVDFGNQSADLKEVRKAVLRKEQYVTLGDGSIGILPQEWIEKYSRYFSAGEVKKDGIQISKFQFTLLDDFEDEVIDTKTLKELVVKRKKLREFEEIKQVSVPKELKAELRDYQQHGLAWLNFLDEFGWGGCLADDMGLGKTVQVIGFLLQQIKKYPDKKNLVIMPTTLLFNWEQELKKFAPSIAYHIHYGAARDDEQMKQSETHLILTSYGTLVRDIEMFKDITFNYVILDESQAIKNSASQRYKAVRLLTARNRIAMSGTPVENNTMELYSQMNFLNPGIFGPMEGFRKDYAAVIDKEGNVEVANRLRKIIRPFLIRRTKEQVAKELPGKTEMTLFCEMGEQQRKVYDAFKEKIRKELIEKIEQEGMNKARFAVLDGLLKLRQICNSPALLNTTEDYGNDSVKADELIWSIREKTGQHKVLVFSQFIGMLDIIRKSLENEQITYEYLDGQSKNRKDSVENFQNNEACRVFLISLKAGGTGLNLTAADYVYIVDPWWNPAVEDQAIDRTYRIGQDKKVFAYRMICHNTIEEKILALQQKKKGLVKDIIGVEEGFVKTLSKEDVMDLLV